MSKKRNKSRRRTFNRHAGWQAIKTTLAGNKYEDYSHDSQAKLMLQAYARVVTLEKGALDVQGFYEMNEMNSIGFSFMEVLNAEGSEAVKADMQRRLPIPLAAADALLSIGERYNRTGKFGASGNELLAIRAAITNLDELSKASPTAVFVKALRMSAVRLSDEMRKKHG